ncbi:MAG: hypothetical protein LBK01_03040 [Burkholderiaceae bacterium]|jgi:hypothetical protein|nr:hypothetical protein [Burkholderiaceae bacterium]
MVCHRLLLDGSVEAFCMSFYLLGNERASAPVDMNAAQIIKNRFMGGELTQDEAVKQLQALGMK